MGASVAERSKFGECFVAADDGLADSLSFDGEDAQAGLSTASGSGSFPSPIAHLTRQLYFFSGGYGLSLLLVMIYMHSKNGAIHVVETSAETPAAFVSEVGSEANAWIRPVASVIVGVMGILLYKRLQACAGSRRVSSSLSSG
jgi:hypothetical protein